MALMEICEFISYNFDKDSTEEINTYIFQENSNDEDIDKLVDAINKNLGDDVHDLQYMNVCAISLPSITFLYKNRTVEIHDCCDSRRNYYWNIRVMPVEN